MEYLRTQGSCALKMREMGVFQEMKEGVSETSVRRLRMTDFGSERLAACSCMNDLGVRAANQNAP